MVGAPIPDRAGGRVNDPGPCPTRGAPRVDDAPDAGAAAPTPRSTARWALLAGRRGRGRIGQLEAAIAGLRGRGIRVGGVVQRDPNHRDLRIVALGALVIIPAMGLTARPLVRTADPTEFRLFSLRLCASA